MTTKSSQKVAPLFSCMYCDYTTYRKGNYNKHITTPKHKNNQNDTKSSKSSNIFIIRSCLCGKVFNDRAGLWRHKKKCHFVSEETFDSVNEFGLGSDSYSLTVCNNFPNHNFIIDVLQQNQEFKELIIEQNKQNQDLQKQLIEITKEGKHITNNMNNTTNNKFNLNFFLNEQCKDAMNIKDFVNSLKLQLSDLENVGESGYAEGISKIFINGLKELDIFKRPIHCSDVKRETLYVKDKDAWEKENQEKEILHWAIKNIAHKNVKQIQEWQEKNPEYKDGESTVHEQFLKIVNESMGGYTDGDDKANYNKIIRNVAKQVVIERQ